MKKFNIKDYLSPKRVYTTLVFAITDIRYRKKYKEILNELEETGKLKHIGLRKERDVLYAGVNLNPELLMYTEDSKESVELKFVSDNMRKYTDFLQNEGILDSIKADYERVYTEDFYGYIVQISYATKYNKSKLKYDISYFAILSSIILTSIYLLIKTVV